MRAFELGLRDDPKIASSICYAIHSLAEAVCVDDDDETSLLSPYVQGLASALLSSTERCDESTAIQLLMVDRYFECLCTLWYSEMTLAIVICSCRRTRHLRPC